VDKEIDEYSPGFSPSNMKGAKATLILFYFSIHELKLMAIQAYGKSGYQKRRKKHPIKKARLKRLNRAYV